MAAAVFSGLPTQELARVMRDQVLPRPELHGVYHVSADPINKYELLMLLAEAYGKAIEIQPDERLVIDRSLDSRAFPRAHRLHSAVLAAARAFNARFRLTPLTDIMFKNKTLLITGGTGSFGNAVLQRFIHSEFGEIRVFSRDEKKQEDMRIALKSDKVKFYIGDVQLRWGRRRDARCRLRLTRPR